VILLGREEGSRDAADAVQREPRGHAAGILFPIGRSRHDRAPSQGPRIVAEILPGGARTHDRPLPIGPACSGSRYSRRFVPHWRGGLRGGAPCSLRQRPAARGRVKGRLRRPLCGFALDPPFARPGSRATRARGDPARGAYARSGQTPRGRRVQSGTLHGALADRSGARAANGGGLDLQNPAAPHRDRARPGREREGADPSGPRRDRGRRRCDRTRLGAIGAARGVLGIRRTAVGTCDGPIGDGRGAMGTGRAAVGRLRGAIGAGQGGIGACSARSEVAEVRSGACAGRSEPAEARLEPGRVAIGTAEAPSGARAARPEPAAVRSGVRALRSRLSATRSGAAEAWLDLCAARSGTARDRRDRPCLDHDGPRRDRERPARDRERPGRHPASTPERSASAPERPASVGGYRSHPRKGNRA
jgi:hypothetical protein